MGSLRATQTAAEELQSVLGTHAGIVRALQQNVQTAIFCKLNALYVHSYLSSLSKIEEGLLTVDAECQPLRAPIDDARTILAPQLHVEEVEVRVTVGEEFNDVYVEMDRKMLVQVLLNLGQNALKYTRSGFVELVLRRATEDEAREASHPLEGAEPSVKLLPVQVEVRDSGVGIDAVRRESIFDRHTTTGGIGLGLYLTRMQLKLLGANIRVTSPWTSKHSGCCFSFALKLKLMEVPQLSGKPESFRGTPLNSDEDPPLLASGVRILIADDLRLNIKLLQRKLSDGDAAVEVATAVSAEEVMQLTKSDDNFDVIIIDEHFGVDCMLGSAAITEIRSQVRARQAHAPCKQPIIISCTANAADMIAALLEAGADAVWGKPFDTDTRRTCNSALQKPAKIKGAMI